MLALRQKRNEFERQALVHVDALYGAAYRLTRNARDAEDLVQDSLLRAYKFWDSFQQDSNCKAWLLRIVTNTFINEYQRRKRSRSNWWLWRATRPVPRFAPAWPGSTSSWTG